MRNYSSHNLGSIVIQCKLPLQPIFCHHKAEVEGEANRTHKSFLAVKRYIMSYILLAYFGLQCKIILCQQQETLQSHF